MLKTSWDWEEKGGIYLLGDTYKVLCPPKEVVFLETLENMWVLPRYKN
jgi:hypothetical protein